MRRQRADVQAVILDGNVLEFAQTRDIDDHLRVTDRMLELDQQIGAARQDLGLGAVLAEQRRSMADIFRRYVSERLHSVCPRCP